jgi:hypothetical protein
MPAPESSIAAIRAGVDIAAVALDGGLTGASA